MKPCKILRLLAIFASLAIFSSFAMGADQGETLNLVDFDGTLFKSPVPNPARLGPYVLGKLRNDDGWFQNGKTLLPPALPENISADWFNQSLIAQIGQVKGAKNFLVTSRSEREFDEQIKKLVGKSGVTFDDIFTDPKVDGISSSQFKINKFKELIARHNPKKIVIYDDRVDHLEKFKKAFAHDDRVEFKLVSPAFQTFLSLEQEANLIDEILPQMKLPFKNIGTAILLADDAVQAIHENFAEKIGHVAKTSHVIPFEHIKEIGTLETYYWHRQGNEGPLMEPNAPGEKVVLDVAAYAVTKEGFAIKCKAGDGNEYIIPIFVDVQKNSRLLAFKDAKWVAREGTFTIHGVVQKIGVFDFDNEKSAKKNAVIAPAAKISEMPPIGKLITTHLPSLKGRDIAKAKPQIEKGLIEKGPGYEYVPANLDNIIRYVQEFKLES